jgi:Ni,Fe-hydrogenase I cytochrome b subunit
VAGLVVAQFGRRLMLGVMVGTVAGIYLDQTYETPDIKSAAVGLLAKVLESLHSTSRMDLPSAMLTRNYLARE